MTALIVSAQWLNNNLNDPNLIILDASQTANKAGLETEFQNVKIKGTRVFDIKNEFSDTSSQFPNTLPTVAAFEIGCRKLGINKKSKIVVYDNLGIYLSPRVWWMFRTMGHSEIAVLDGGLPNWIQEGYETVKTETPKWELGDFEAQLQPQNVKAFDFVKQNSETQNSLLLDARSEGRFNGTAAEPRADLKSGNIPNSINIPFGKVLENGKMKSKVELKKIFAEIGEKPLVFSCGSGITACIILLASEFVLENKKSVYDGSWTEWVQLND